MERYRAFILRRTQSMLGRTGGVVDKPMGLNNI